MERRLLTPKENIVVLLQKSFRDSFALADSQSIMTSDNVKDVLAKADAQAEALKSKVDG